MEATLIKFILSPFGVVGIVVAVLLLAFVAVYKLTKWATTINASNKSIEERVKKYDDSIDDIRRDLSYIKRTLDILTKANDSGNSLAQAHSPISLTEKGNAIAKDLNIDVIIADNWNNIVADLDVNVKDKNPYDIKQYCREVAAVSPERFFKEEDIRAIKGEAFRLGRSFFELSIIPALKIRDKYLAEKGISIDEIDRHDPNKAH